MAPHEADSEDSMAKDPAVLDQSGAVEVRLATKPSEIEEAQRLRYDVFYREMSAVATPEMKAAERDFDEYDPICEHLLVVDRDAGDKVVGTYRLMTSEASKRSHKGFYTAGEYDIGPMLRAREGQKLLELGRSCVLRSYRTGPTMQLLWRGLFVYLLRNHVDLMFGCASLPSTDPKTLALELSYLYHFHLAPEGERVRALPERFVSMNQMPKDAINEAEALHSLPPLVKGYLRTGAYIGDGAVVDHQFGTTDVFIYFPTTRLAPRWRKHLMKKVGSD